MSTIKVTNVQNPSAASAAITLDTNGQATLNGLAYPTSGSLSGRNRIINGDMRIDQRNAGAAVTLTSAGVYTVDRWQGWENTDGTATATRSTTAPTGYTNSLLYTVTSADTSLSAGQYTILGQRVEGFNSADFAFGTASAATITLSFWVRSSIAGTFAGGIVNNANNRSYVFTYAISAANTWEYKSVTISGDTSGTWLTDNGIGLNVYFALGASSDFQATAGSWGSALSFATSSSVNLIATNGATFYITGVQLEAGSVATPFERRSYGQELALCQRYFETSYPAGTSPGSVYEPAPTAQSARTNEFRTWQTFKVDKRAVATVKFYSPTTGTVDKFRNRQTGADINVTADSASTTGTRVSSNAGSSGDLIAWNYTAEAEL